jgi:hypothetical protein
VSALAGWQNFYVIVGSSAGALIGLQFVVMTLIASRHREQSAGRRCVWDANGGSFRSRTASLRGG